jgi:hypothetical protein
MIRRRTLFGLTLVALCGLCVQWQGLRAAELPTRIDDRTFWKMITDFSEPDGAFHSDNFTSNESTFQYVIPELQRRLDQGGAYIGVGPEQNFTYVVALRPRVAFIVDIRRQNMLQHLLYKALIELSADRVEFLSRLFSKKPPMDLGSAPNVDRLFLAYHVPQRSRELFQENLQAVKDRLVRHHGFALTTEDLDRIEYVYNAFYERGPDLRYTFEGAGLGVLELFPIYTELMTATDGDGKQRGYLATEENFRILRQLQLNNAIIPLVGDFAGPKAIQAVGRYISEQGAFITAFYLSNVEQYLFQREETWKRFYSNVATLPIDEKSTIVRSVSDQNSVPGRLSMPRTSLISDLLAAFSSGKITNYLDIVAMSK